MILRVLLLYEKLLFSNKYLFLGVLFSIVTIVFFIQSMIQFFDYQTCYNFLNAHPSWMGAHWEACYAERDLVQDNLLLGINTSSAAITMIVIYFKQW